MPTVIPTATLNAYFSGTGSASTDITADVVLGVQPLTGKYGITGTGPTSRVGRTGTMTFAMNNSTSNSGGVQGYYTPGHTNARSTGTLGWNLGLVISVTLSYGGTNYIKFIGTLTDVKPDAGRYRRQSVRCTVLDWMDEAGRSKLKALSVQTGQRSDQLITTLVTNSVGRQPISTDYDTGRSTFAYALDNLSDNKTSVLKALSDVVMSEMGYLYIRGTTDAASAKGGKLTFENRTARLAYGASDHTFAHDMVRLDARQSRADIINHTYVQVHPRTLDTAATVLWELTTTEVVPSVEAGATTTIIAQFSDKIITGVNFGASTSTTARGAQVATTNLTTPASGTDWVANSAADGSGSNLTANVAVTVATTAANTATLQIVNSGASKAYLTTLQVRGVAIKDQTTTTVDDTNATSITTYGEQDVSINMPYESDPDLALEIARWQNAATDESRFVVKSMEIAANTSAELMEQALVREPGDKIGIDETMTGLNNDEAWHVGTAGESELGATTWLDYDPSSGDFFIQGVSFTLSAGSILKVKWNLQPADQSGAWILGVVNASQIGETTILSWSI
jgi:hypothetical protein